MIFLQIERLLRCTEFDGLIVATSTDPSDDDLVEACDRHNVVCFRGALNDVLDRFVQAARLYIPDTIVRLTGDCPLADPWIVDDVIRYFYLGGYDYASNCSPPTFPDGLDVEVMRFSCLELAHREADLPSYREHVTPFIRKQPDIFRVANYAAEIDRSHLRWTVDEPEDFEFVRQVYEHLYPDNPAFTTADVLNLLAEHPELQLINKRFERNEGAKKSLLADTAFLAEKN